MPKIVLVNPQIPPNTGNIARTCAATDSELHLVEPLGFDLSDRYLKRAGLDYWPHVKLQVHSDWNAFYRYQGQVGGRTLGFSTRGRCSYIDFDYQATDWLLFGSETDGLSSDILQSCTETLHIPIDRTLVRSLNLSSSVAIAVFESLRQLRSQPSQQV